MDTIKDYYEKSAGIYDPQGRQIYLTHDKFEGFIEMMNENRTGGQKILDIGCGNGWLSTLYRLEGDEVHGIDISELNIEKAKSRGVQALLHNVENGLPYNDSFFDIIICVDVLEHLFFPEKIVKETYRVLKNNGILIVGVPNLYCLRNKIEMFLGKAIFIEYPMNFEHIRHYSKRTISKILTDNGFSIIKTRGSGWTFNSERFFWVLSLLHGGNHGLKLLLKFITLGKSKEEFPALALRHYISKLLNKILPGLSCGITVKAKK